MPVWPLLSLLDLFFGVKGLVVPSEQSAPSFNFFPRLNYLPWPSSQSTIYCLPDRLAGINAGKYEKEGHQWLPR